MKRQHIIFAVFITALFFSCRKNPVAPTPSVTPTNPVTPVTVTPTELQLVSDSVYLFSREIYYWDSLRNQSTYTSFNPRQYVGADDVETAKSALAAIKNYSYWDKTKSYSYAGPYQESSTSAATQNINGYGFYFKAGYKNSKIYTQLYTNNSDFNGWYVTYVYPSSDAGLKGVKRGMKILSVNGTNVNAINQAAVDVFNNMFYYETLKSANISFLRAVGDTLNVNVGITTFTPNSVLFSKVITSQTNKKVGYIVLNFFDKLADVQSALSAVFQDFKSQGITEMVIDLRYNHGGRTETQDYLANSVVPAASGVMYKYHYNSNLQSGNYSLMKTRGNYDFSLSRNTVYFNPACNFNLQKIYVIVGRETASASELFINNIRTLLPLDTKLILLGDDNTYGKSVGFFPVDLFKKVTFWVVSFMTKNANGDSVSYSGFKPSYKIYDGVEKNWGDLNEDCLKAALSMIDGQTPVTSGSASATETIIRSVLPSLEIKQKENFYHNNMIVGR